jgi:hypothetical protein
MATANWSMDIRSALRWYRGRLIKITNDKEWFIKPLNNLPYGYDTTQNVFMSSDNVLKYILPAKVGDTVEFLLGDRNKSKPTARKARISQYCPRTYDEVLQYMNKLIMDLNSNISKNLLVEILPNTAMWSVLASPVFTSQTGRYNTFSMFLSPKSTVVVIVLS